MKVLYFHQHFVTPKGAGAIRSYAMARKLIAKGHSVIMVCGSAQGSTTGLSGPFKKGFRRGYVDGIDVVELNLSYSNKDSFLKRIFTFLMFALRSIWISLTENYDVVFATTTPLTAGIPGIFARWLRFKPFVFEVRDLWPELPREMGVIKNPIVLWGMGFLEWASYRSAHHTIGLSPGIVKGISRLGVEEEKISMIPNGCDLNIFGAEQAIWRPEGVSQSDFLAIYTGTHGIANGLNAVLDAAKELKERNREDIKILLIGDGKLKETLEQRAKSEGLKNLIFHPPVSKDKISALMSSADIGMQVLANVPAFYYGTSPNKFFDYISAGLPVLNNYPGWLADMIKKENCGFSVVPDDPKQFASALEQAADNKPTLKLMGENAFKLAQREFDRELLSDQFVQVIESVMPNE